jgi:hypothetical protein
MAMTVEEALKNTFVCTRLPGGYARMSYETCVMRQSQAVFIRPDLESRYVQCVDCPQGRENIRIYEEKTGMKMGKCSNCGRRLYVTEGKVPLCYFCGKTVKAGGKAGVDRETALEAARGLVKFIKPGRRDPILYPWDEVKKGDSIMEEAGIEPNIPEEAGIEPNIPVEAGIEPNIPVEAGIEPNIPVEAGIEPNIPEEAGIEPNIPVESPIDDERGENVSGNTAPVFSLGQRRYAICFEGTDRDQRIREWLMAVSSIARRDPEQQILIILEDKMKECEGI